MQQNALFVMRSICWISSDIDMPPSSHPNHVACCAAEAKTCLDNLGSVICYTAWLLCAEGRVSIEHNSAAFVIRDAFLSELSLCDDILPKTTSKTKKKMFITKLKLRFLLSLLEEFAFPLQDMVASLIKIEVYLFGCLANRFFIRFFDFRSRNSKASVATS